MVAAIRVHRAGGPEVLALTDAEIGTPGPREVLIDVAAAGVNYIDIYQRSGLYPVELPFVPGNEGSGTIAAIGSEVTDFHVGDRVAWQGSLGSYTRQRLMPIDNLVRLPERISDEIGAAVMLQGITAHYLVASTYPVRAEDTILVHAAAGGVGLLLIQLAKARGARVIGTVSTEAKERLAREAGADEIIRYDTTNFVDAVNDLTDGKGVSVVYDGVGRSTFDGSLASVKKRGMVVLFGAASGPVPPVDPQRLNSAGSVFLTRPTSGDYVQDRAELTWRVNELFDAIVDGQLTVRIGNRYPLADARQAHEDLEQRRTTGKQLLIP